jgi:hypothetical protein
VAAGGGRDATGVTLLALGSLPAMAIAALVAVLPTFIEHFSTARITRCSFP